MPYVTQISLKIYLIFLLLHQKFLLIMFFTKIAVLIKMLQLTPRQQHRTIDKRGDQGAREIFLPGTGKSFVYTASNSLSFEQT